MRIVIVGCGLIGHKRAESVGSAGDTDRIVAVCDVEPKQAEELGLKSGSAVYTDWRDLFEREEFDAVVVATVNKFLAPIAISALDRGKHVLCEKPLGRNAEESLAMVTRAAANKVVLKTGFNHRHHPALQKAKRMLDEGFLGSLYFLRGTYGHGGRPGYDKEWRADKDLCGGGELLDQGVHVIDLFRWFAGDFEEVFGVLPTYYWDMEVEDNAFAILRTASRLTAVMHTSWTQWRNRFRFEVFGEKGYLIVDGLGGSYGMETLIVGKRKVDVGAGAPRYIGGAPDEERFEFPGPDVSWSEEWKEFTAAIREGREPCGSGRDGLMANRVIEAVYGSSRANRPVKVENEG